MTALMAALALCVSGRVGFAIFSPFFRDREPPRMASVRIGAEVINVANAYLRADARTREESGPVELAAFFPGFGPAGRSDDVTAHTDLNDRFERIVVLSLIPADALLDPSERTARLYERFLEDASWTNPGGLVSRAFQSGSPFEGDELYYAPPEGRRFAARCRKPDANRKTPNTCVAVFRSGGLDVDMRFSATLLSEWEKLLAGARGLIEAARR